MKGVSAMIAAVLLIALTVLVSTIVMNWVTTLSKTQQEKISNKTSEGVTCTSASINNDAVYLDATTNTSRVVVRNDGLVDDSIVSASLLSKTGSSATNLTASPVSILRGSISSVTFNMSPNVPNCGNFSQVRVSTSCTSDVFDGTPKNC